MARLCRYASRSAAKPRAHLPVRPFPLPPAALTPRPSLPRARRSPDGASCAGWTTDRHPCRSPFGLAALGARGSGAPYGAPKPRKGNFLRFELRWVAVGSPLSSPSTGAWPGGLREPLIEPEGVLCARRVGERPGTGEERRGPPRRGGERSGRPFFRRFLWASKEIDPSRGGGTPRHFASRSDSSS